MSTSSFSSLSLAERVLTAFLAGAAFLELDDFFTEEAFFAGVFGVFFEAGFFATFPSLPKRLIEKTIQGGCRRLHAGTPSLRQRSLRGSLTCPTNLPPAGVLNKWISADCLDVGRVRRHQFPWIFPAERVAGRPVPDCPAAALPPPSSVKSAVSSTTSNVSWSFEGARERSSTLRSHIRQRSTFVVGRRAAVCDHGDGHASHSAGEHELQDSLAQERLSAAEGEVKDLDPTEQCSEGTERFPKPYRLGSRCSRAFPDVVAVAAVQVALRRCFEDDPRKIDRRLSALRRPRSIGKQRTALQLWLASGGEKGGGRPAPTMPLAGRHVAVVAVPEDFPFAAGVFVKNG